MRGKLLFACMSFGLSLSAVEPVAKPAANLPSLAWISAYLDARQSDRLVLRCRALATFHSDGRRD